MEKKAEATKMDGLTIAGIRKRVGIAFRSLVKRGILAKENFSCCQTCGNFAMRETADILISKGQIVRGWVFWNRQYEDSLKNNEGLVVTFSSTDDKSTSGFAIEDIGVWLAYELKKARLKFSWNSSNETKIKVVGLERSRFRG